jgi:predicted mannosyl-3-phosphoglycerate phosphatase (HAD superfamily)
VSKQKPLVKTVPLSGVRRLVRDVLERSPSYHQLSPVQQKDLAANMVKVTALLAVPAEATVAAVDFPAFVKSIIEGVFNAMVVSSIRQMEAYADLVKDISANVDDISSDNEDGMRDFICRSLAKKIGVNWPPR